MPAYSLYSFNIYAGPSIEPSIYRAFKVLYPWKISWSIYKKKKINSMKRQTNMSILLMKSKQNSKVPSQSHHILSVDSVGVYTFSTYSFAMPFLPLHPRPRYHQKFQWFKVLEMWVSEFQRQRQYLLGVCILPHISVLYQLISVAVTMYLTSVELPKIKLVSSCWFIKSMKEDILSELDHPKPHFPHHARCHSHARHHRVEYCRSSSQTCVRIFPRRKS